ncbi:uncharacterized protein LOC120689852 isoform X2 [Panicum virgatum]|uniref:Transmembrane protein n=1 Tax=Panicum virgatum TaxID=38727 RepID=A0A8T0MHE2_PANVG|nr:uncharacterized protein LOC120689852 isoform X2 [Panicum virgatum]KAG2536168.1 hypothetical protein PVAP13_9NG165273 [Panicum virgatum]
MSVAAARSPSPGPAARPCCGLRRSADSSPFRPAASPPDSPQRSSSVCKNGSGRASPRPCFPEKENDPREPVRTSTSKVRCSGVGAAKSFMAPTISAASKAVAPSASPRKRILGERNDPVPSSSGDLAHCAKPRGAPSLEAAPLGAPRRLRFSLDGAPAPHHAAAPPPSHSFGAGDEEAENPVCASRQDGGSAAAPYDPKTNYLSPRPRFLRYKPNPRVEMYRHSSGGGVRRLEEGFASDNSSEEVSTATTTEEDVSEGEQEQTTLSSVLDDSTEEEMSALAPAPEAGVEPAASTVAGILQPHPATDSPVARVMAPVQKKYPRAGGVLTPEQELAESLAAARPKKKSPLRFLLAPFVLVLFMAAAFVCVPPLPGSPVMLNTFPSKVSDFLLVQEVHPVELAARLKQWSSSSLDFVTSYWEALGSSQQQEVFGPHFAANLSAPAVDADHAVGFYYGAAQTSPISVEHELEIQEIVSESGTEMIAEPDVEEMANFGDAEVEEPIDDAEMKHEFAVPSVIQEANDSVDAEVEEPIDDAEMEHESAVPSVIQEANDSVDAEVEEFDTEMEEEVSGNSGEEMAEEVSGSGSKDRAAFIQNSDITPQSAAESQQAEDMAKSSLQQDVQTEDSEGDRADGKEDQEAHQGEKLGSDMWPSYLDKISNPATLGAALAAIIVPAVLALLYIRQKQARVTLDSNEPAEQVEQVEKVESLSGSGSSEGYVVAKSSQFQNLVVEESEKLGGSGTSQYSSNLSSGLGRRRKAREEVSLGLEPVVSRRDSTAQSTASYGSFTTYEKIPAKKGNKEDEAMTPVRRSRRNVKPPES